MTKPVLDTPEDVTRLLNRDVDNLLSLRKDRNEIETERLNAKANAVDAGLRTLVRAVKDNPEDADAAYCEVIEKILGIIAEKGIAGEFNELYAARLEGRKQGLEHVLYRVRGARA